MGFERDIERIKNANALEDIRAVVREYPARASGGVAALYSGPVGPLSANDLAVGHASRTRSSIINNTPRGRFLADEQIRIAVQNAAERIFKSQGADRDLSRKLREDFLYGDAKAPKDSYTSIHNCLWCEASREFAASLTGDVKVIAVNANPSRVFAQVEVPTALQNPNVRSLGGLPLDSLRATYEDRGVEGLLARVQANYVEEATQAGLLPTPAAEPVAGIRRAPGMKLHVAQIAAKGLGAAGTVATVYDGVASIRQVSQLRAQGNDFGAQSHIVGAVSRNVGGLGGVALGASAGAVIASETGPGAFIGGAVGGIAGAVAGDKLAAWIDHHRINQQTDPEGRRWHFDPEHPAQGWTRSITGALDAKATVDRGAPVFTGQTLTAPPDLADRLNYQASSRAVELALSAPPRAQNPYILPSKPQDHRRGNLYEGDWRRDGGREEWSRHVTDSHVGVSMQRYQIETASPQRAMELDRQSQAIVAKNLEAMPAAMAANYKTAYEQFGWSRHGEMPTAVHDAMQHPERMVASNGRIYTRGDDERWTTPGMLYGRNTAEGNLHSELELTDRFFVALEAGDREGMRTAAKAFAESDVGKQVRADALQEIADEQRALPGRDHPLFVQAMQHLEDLGPEVARYRDDSGMERIAGAIAFEAKRDCMGGIDAIALCGSGELVATWSDPRSRWHRHEATVDPTLAAIQPLDQSFQQLSQETMEQAQQALQREQAMSQSQSRGMSR